MCTVSKLARCKPVSLAYLLIWVPVFNFWIRRNAEADATKKSTSRHIFALNQDPQRAMTTARRPRFIGTPDCVQSPSHPSCQALSQSGGPLSLPPDTLPAGPRFRQLTSSLTFKVAEINHSSYLTLGTTCSKLFFALQMFIIWPPNNNPL